MILPLRCSGVSLIINIALIVLDVLMKCCKHNYTRTHIHTHRRWRGLSLLRSQPHNSSQTSMMSWLAVGLLQCLSGWQPGPREGHGRRMYVRGFRCKTLHVIKGVKQTWRRRVCRLAACLSSLDPWGPRDIPERARQAAPLPQPPVQQTTAGRRSADERRFRNLSNDHRVRCWWRDRVCGPVGPTDCMEMSVLLAG